jgi:hypothetical protein
MIGTAAELRSWFNVQLDPLRDTELERCLVAAGTWVTAATGRDIEQANYVERLDGSQAKGRGCEILYLNAGRHPITYPGSGATLLTVTEDGTALTLAEGYSTTAGVLVVNANLDAPCRLVRNGTAWSDGAQNIAVAYQAGFASASVPAWIKQTVYEVALHLFKSPAWIGQAAQSAAGAAVTFQKDLSPFAQDSLRRLRAAA